MTEREFLDQIDCRFPYHDKAKWRAQVDLARTISPNAAFAVLSEISRPPESEPVPPSLLREMASYWRAGFEHPLADVVSDCASARIDGREAPAQRAYEIMETISQYPGQYAALSIVYFACEADDGEVDRLWDAITAQWRPEGINLPS
jgi:hypothetical protein